MSKFQRAIFVRKLNSNKQIRLLWGMSVRTNYNSTWCLKNWAVGKDENWNSHLEWSEHENQLWFNTMFENWALGKDERMICIAYPVEPSKPADATRVITTLAIDLDNSEILLKTFLTSSNPFKWLSTTSFIGIWQTVSLLDILAFNESGKYLK